MSLEQYIAQMAADLAAQSQQSAASLQRQLDDVEARKVAIQAKLDSANLAGYRLANFKVKIGPYYQCPKCWIASGIQSDLKSVPSGGSREDLFRCNFCGFDFIVANAPVPC